MNLRPSLDVLVVEDNPTDVLLLRELCSEMTDVALLLTEAGRLGQAVEMLQDTKFNAVLLDLGLPDSKGLDTFLSLHEKAPEIPLLILTGQEDQITGQRAMRHGAQDYLVKGQIQGALLERSIRYAIERHRITQELQQAQEGLRRDLDILSCLPDAVVFTGLDANVIYWNDSATQLLGWSAEEMVGHPFFDCLPASEHAHARAALSTLQRRKEYQEERQMTRKDGSRVWVRMRAFAFQDAKGKPSGILAIFQDVSERRRLEEELRQSQKMDAIGTLAGGIAHDLNNIMTAITGYTELARGQSQDEQVCANLDTVLQASERAGKLVSQILTFSRQQIAERRPIQLSDLVEESLNLLRATLPSTIEINSFFAQGSTGVLADAGQVQQILLNLGANALHAMKNRQGRLEVRLEPFEVDDSLAAANPLLQPGSYLRISVTDNGHGMDAETMQRIFEPFFTTKPLGEGTGLGLSTVHGIMRSHEGAITVYSEPGKGTTFRLYFPAYVDAERTVQITRNGAPGGLGQRILFVDDEPPLADLGGKVLQKLGYQPECFTNGAAALERLREEPQGFALLITDQTMPGMTGVELARQARQINPHQPILLTTGFSTSLTPAATEEAGIRTVLSKPYTIQALAETVHEVLMDSAPAETTAHGASGNNDMPVL